MSLIVLHSGFASKNYSNPSDYYHTVLVLRVTSQQRVFANSLDLLLLQCSWFFHALIIMALDVIAVEQLLHLVHSLGIPFINHSHNNYRLLWMATAILDIHGLYRNRQTRPPPRPMDVDGKGMPLDSVQPDNELQH